MKRFAVLLLSLSLLYCFSGCKKENNPDNPAGPDQGFELLTEAVVGPGGGQLLSDGHMIVDVPAGSFGSSVTLQAFTSEEQNPFGDDGAASPLVYLKGLPADFSKPVRIAVKHDGSALEDTYIGWGFVAGTTTTFDTVFGYKLIPATDSSGYLVGMILPVDDGSREALGEDHSHKGKYGVPFLCVRNMKYYLTDHFQIFFHSSYYNLNTIPSLAGGLEDAYSLLQSWGFKYDARKEWPLEVQVKPLKDIDGQSLRRYPHSNNTGYIEINSGIITDHNRLRITGAHEFFHVVQDLYNSNENYNWLQEASSTWFEAYLTLNPGTYKPATYSRNRLEVFYGVKDGNGPGEGSYGYAASSMLKYLINYNNAAQNPNVIFNVWSAAKTGKPPVEAIHAIPMFNSTSWWKDYMKEQLIGNIFMDTVYNQVNKIYFNHHGGSWSIDTQDDKLKEFPMLGWDFSGDIYKIDPNYSQLAQGSALEISHNGSNNYLHAFRIGKGITSIQLTGEGENKVTVFNLKDYVDTEDLIYVLVSNWPAGYSSNGTNPYTLKLEVKDSGLNEYTTAGFVRDGSNEFSGNFKFKISTTPGQNFTVVHDRMDTTDIMIKKYLQINFNQPQSGAFTFNIECEALELFSSFPGNPLINGGYVQEFFWDSGVNTYDLTGPFSQPVLIHHVTVNGGYCVLNLRMITDQGGEWNYLQTIYITFMSIRE